MANTVTRNIRLGIMVASGMTFLIIGLYVVGDKQNLFGSTFEIKAFFRNVNGLMEGNNVRFVGVDIGTVNTVEIINDSTVKVKMAIDSDYQGFIKKNATATIGTDGLMGNKLINIDYSTIPAPSIEDGDIIQTLQPLQTDAVFRTLNRTNDDITVIVQNLRVFTEKMNSPNSLLNVLTDTSMKNNILETMSNIKLTSNYSAVITKDLADIVNGVGAGEGLIGELLSDTTFVDNLNKVVDNIDVVSDSLLYLSSDLIRISSGVLNGDGAIGTVLTDTTFDRNLVESVENIKNTSESLEEAIEALKHNFLFRRYYKKKKKEEERRRKGGKAEDEEIIGN